MCDLPVANIVEIEYKDGEIWYSVPCPVCGHKNIGWVLSKGETPAGYADTCDGCGKEYEVATDPDFVARRVEKS